MGLVVIEEGCCSFGRRVGGLFKASASDDNGGRETFLRLMLLTGMVDGFNDSCSRRREVFVF
jgi:hypothetical protein